MHDEMGCHTVGKNDCIGICLAGNFDASVPNIDQEASLRGLLKALAKDKSIKPVPHRKFAPHKSCYGSYLSNE